MPTLKLGDGTDGDITISSNTNLHTTAVSDGRTEPDMCAYTVSAIGTSDVTLDEDPVGMVVGDEVILINLYGRPADPAGNRISNAGRYETFTITDIETSPNYKVIFGSTIEKYYGDGATDNLNVGLNPVMLQRVPNYNSLVVDNGYTLTGERENGDKYGVLFMRVRGTCLVNGTISMSEKGGWGGKRDGNTSGHGRGAGRGRGYNSGGPWSGGGGGHHSQGQTDSFNYGPPNYHWHQSYGDANLDRLSMGSGGGSGADNGGATIGQGGHGGGAIFISANVVDVYGSIQADGGTGQTQSRMAGGSGAGGGVLIHTGTIYTRSGSVTAVGNTAGRDSGYGRVAVYYSTLGDQITTGGRDNLFTSEDITLPFKVSGTITGATGSVRITLHDKDNAQLLGTSSGTNGPYEMTAPGLGPYDIMSKDDAGEMVGYGDITAYEI